jgi:hypothetical protein
MGGLIMTFDERVDILKRIGFTETRVGMTNGTYAFLWYQIDTGAMSDKEFKEYYNSMTNKLGYQQDSN